MSKTRTSSCAFITRTILPSKVPGDTPAIVRDEAKQPSGDHLRTFMKSFVYRWLSNVNQGLIVYESHNCKHYEEYRNLKESAKELFRAYTELRDAPTLTPEIAVASLVFGDKYTVLYSS
jgi:hypothetical protein